MPADLMRGSDSTEVKEEGNLLIEAVSLLVQRQRETEAWMAEQLWQTEQRAADSERRYAELESRLAGIEARLARLVQEVEPSDDPQIARLREQIEGLRGGPGRREPILESTRDRQGAESTRGKPGAESSRGEPVAESPRGDSSVETPRGEPIPDSTRREAVVAARRAERPVGEPRRVPGEPGPARTAASPTFLELLGSNATDRAGALVMALGAIAIVFAILTQLRFA